MTLPFGHIIIRFSLFVLGIGLLHSHSAISQDTPTVYIQVPTHAPADLSNSSLLNRPSDSAMRPFRGTRPNDGILIIPGHSPSSPQDLQMQIMALELQVTKQKELIESQSAYIARLEAEITRLKPPVPPNVPQP